VLWQELSASKVAGKFAEHEWVREEGIAQTANASEQPTHVIQVWNEYSVGCETASLRSNRK